MHQKGLKNDFPWGIDTAHAVVGTRNFFARSFACFNCYEADQVLPFLCRSTEIITYGRTKVAILVIFVFAVVYNISRFFEITWISSIDPDTNTTRSITLISSSCPGLPASFSFLLSLEVSMTEMRQNSVYVSVYITWMYLVFMYTLPFTGLSVLNLLMFLDVRYVKVWSLPFKSVTPLFLRTRRRSNSRNVTLSSSQKKEMKLAIMLMVVVLVFLICNALAFIVNIMELFAFR